VTVRIINADVMDGLAQLEPESVHCVVTSPPYFGLRDYGMPGQIGLEPTPDLYVSKLVEVFREVRRVLRKDGTCWLNLGDSYCSQGGLHDGRADNQSGVGAKRVWRDGSGRADGIVDARGQRNRNGNSVIGLKPKDLIGIPWRVAFALQADGWWLRQDIIWSKPNPMPESVTDRCTKAHEYLFMLTKSARYFYDADAIAEPAIYVGVVGQDANGFKNPLRFDGKMAASTKQDGHGRRHAGFNARWDEAEARGECSQTRNKRSVWEVTTQPFPEAHFATFPPALIEPCIKAGCPEGGTVLDPFGGSGTTGLVADRLKRNAILIELNPEYAAMAQRRISGDCPMFAEVKA
jgi:DNA modification methylase